MAIQIQYTVHSVHQTTTAVRAQFAGREVDATIPALVVELLSDDGVHGHTFRFVPQGEDDLKAHLELFVPGRRIVSAFAPAA
jgi:hypothetical protein